MALAMLFVCLDFAQRSRHSITSRKRASPMAFAQSGIAISLGVMGAGTELSATALAIWMRVASGMEASNHSFPPPRPERGRDCQPSRIARLSTDCLVIPSRAAASCVLYASFMAMPTTPSKKWPGLCRSGLASRVEEHGLRRCTLLSLEMRRKPTRSR